MYTASANASLPSMKAQRGSADKRMQSKRSVMTVSVK